MLASGGGDGALRSLSELAESLTRMTAAAAGAVRPLTCPLTAGRDSRVLISLLLAAGIEPDCYTTGHPGELDVEVSRALAEQLDLPYRVQTPEVPAPTGMSGSRRRPASSRRRTGSRASTASPTTSTIRSRSSGSG